MPDRDQAADIESKRFELSAKIHIAAGSGTLVQVGDQASYRCFLI